MATTVWCTLFVCLIGTGLAADELKKNEDNGFFRSKTSDDDNIWKLLHQHPSTIFPDMYPWQDSLDETPKSDIATYKTPNLDLPFDDLYDSTPSSHVPPGVHAGITVGVPVGIAVTVFLLVTCCICVLRRQRIRMAEANLSIVNDPNFSRRRTVIIRRRQAPLQSSRRCNPVGAIMVVRRVLCISARRVDDEEQGSRVPYEPLEPPVPPSYEDAVSDTNGTAPPPYTETASP